MTEPNDLPPVGATVTDQSGRVYELRRPQWEPCTSARTCWMTLHEGQWVIPDPDWICDLDDIFTLAWRMQQERDQLKARVAEMEQDRVELSRALTLVCNREWIIAPWCDDTWRVNVQDGPPRDGSQHYKGTQWVGSTAVDAALAAIAAQEVTP